MGSPYGVKPGLPSSAVSRRPAARRRRGPRLFKRGPSDWRAPERQHEPQAGAARISGLLRRTNGFHPIPRADARGFHRASERDLRRRRSVRRNGRQGQGRRDRKRHGRHRRRPQDRRARGAQGIHQSRPRSGARARRRGRSLSRADRECARRSRHLARQGEARGELGQARAGVREEREGRRRHLQPGQGRLHRRSRRGGRLPAAQPGRHPPGARRRRR